MAIVTDNIVLEGLSGMVGRAVVFRELNGKTIVQAAPVRKAPYNGAQKKQQGRFKVAMAYARRRMQNPALKARYMAQAKLKGGSTNPFNMAIAEYFRLEKMRALVGRGSGPGISVNRSLYCGSHQVNYDLKDLQERDLALWNNEGLFACTKVEYG
jgi:hypothetical protein